MIEQKCNRCRHQWTYKGRKTPTGYQQFITCPRCYTKVKLIFENVKGGIKK